MDKLLVIVTAPITIVFHAVMGLVAGVLNGCEEIAFLWREPEHAIWRKRS